VVFEKLMPEELEKRDVSDAAAACSEVIEDLVNNPAPPDEAPAADVDSIFRRLANG
jgi:hypothetical protein